MDLEVILEVMKVEKEVEVEKKRREIMSFPME